MMPITKLPLITKWPNASMTWPAAAVPSWPCPRINRVDAMLSDSRSMVEISRMVGNAENSSGVWMNSDVIRIRTENVIETASAKSRSSGGNGRMRITRIVMMPSASPISPRRSMVPRLTRRDSPVSAVSAEPVSLISVDPLRLRPRESKLCVAAGMPPTWGSGATPASKACSEERGGKVRADQLRQSAAPPATRPVYASCRVSFCAFWAKCAGCMVTGRLTARRRHEGRAGKVMRKVAGNEIGAGQSSCGRRFRGFCRSRARCLGRACRRHRTRPLAGRHPEQGGRHGQCAARNRRNA